MNLIGLPSVPYSHAGDIYYYLVDRSMLYKAIFAVLAACLSNHL
jgi:hypothetical protein